MNCSAGPENGFNTITVVSPAQLGDEAKDQDRACWHGATSTASLSDGVSTSPFSGEAAAMAVDFAPAVLREEATLEANLKALCDWLVTHRLEAVRRPLRMPAGTSPGMSRLLEEVSRDNLSRSFQTTFVAASFVRADEMILASVVSVGDSGFFAFSPEGDLLTTTLAGGPAWECGDRDHHQAPEGSGEIGLRPATELLVEVLCNASERPDLCEQSGIPSRSASSWLVCTLRVMCEISQAEPAKPQPPAVPLTSGDLLLVPTYLAEPPEDARRDQYRWVRYSRALRLLSSHAMQPRLQGRSAATAVLPDHFSRGGWGYFRERFPSGAQFVLASDGFYSCFPSPEDLWRWLNENCAVLSSAERRPALMTSLHQRLYDASGDDDMSFVWIRTSAPAGGEGGDCPEVNCHDGEEHHAC